jgi:hypothetical protein
VDKEVKKKLRRRREKEKEAEWSKQVGKFYRARVQTGNNLWLSSILCSFWAVQVMTILLFTTRYLH